MAKKTKKPSTKSQGKRSARPAAAAPAPVTTTPAAKRPAVARTRRATATPAQRRGAELARYLRIHLKRPYGERGIRAIVELTKEVGHLARVELGEIAHVPEN
jgi:hypothetical protein